MNTVDSGNELKRVYKEVKRVAYKRGMVGINDYEDIAQEAMIRYLKKSGGEFAPYNWINLVVKSVTWDMCRKRYSQIAVMEEFSDETKMCDAWQQAEFRAAVCEPLVEDEVDRKYLEIALIGLLGEGTFEILKLYADGYSYKEISQMVNIKIGTIRSRIHNARLRAKKMLAAS